MARPRTEFPLQFSLLEFGGPRPDNCKKPVDSVVSSQPVGRQHGPAPGGGRRDGQEADNGLTCFTAANADQCNFLKSVREQALTMHCFSRYYAYQPGLARWWGWSPGPTARQRKSRGTTPARLAEQEVETTGQLLSFDGGEGEEKTSQVLSYLFLTWRCWTGNNL